MWLMFDMIHFSLNFFYSIHIIYISHFPNESNFMKSLLTNPSHVNHFNYMLINIAQGKEDSI